MSNFQEVDFIPAHLVSFLGVCKARWQFVVTPAHPKGTIDCPHLPGEDLFLWLVNTSPELCSGQSSTQLLSEFCHRFPIVAVLCFIFLGLALLCNSVLFLSCRKAPPFLQLKLFLGVGRWGVGYCSHDTEVLRSRLYFWISQSSLPQNNQIFKNRWQW